jgi:hypothetical protein
MAQFTISFTVEADDEQAQAPVYRMRVATGLQGSDAPLGIDNGLLVIQRKMNATGEEYDEFYGVVKASDFKSMSMFRPEEGKSFYRVAEWNLVFYNLKTLTEAKELLRAQVNGLADDVSVYDKQLNNRFETFFSKDF